MRPRCYSTWLFVLAPSLFPASSLAGWFGPDNYDDCILESMKGVTNRAAAAYIADACARKFPDTAPRLEINADDASKAREKAREYEETASAIQDVSFEIDMLLKKPEMRRKVNGIPFDLLLDQARVRQKTVSLAEAKAVLRRLQEFKSLLIDE